MIHAAADTAGHLFTLGVHHPMLGLFMLGLALVALWMLKRVMFGQAGAAPVEVVEVSDAFPAVVVVCGCALLLILGNQGTPAASAPRRVVERITHVTHITHVTQHVAASNGGWWVAGIAIVAVLAFVAFLNRRIGR